MSKTKRMRLTRLSVSSLVLLAMLLPAAPIGAGPVDQTSFAIAEWTGKRLDKYHWQWIGAMVWSDAPVAGEPQYLGGVFKGICTRKHENDGYSVMCRGRGRGLRGRDTFSMDVAASQAVLDQYTRAGHHHVDWTAVQDSMPGRFTSHSSCAAGEGNGAGIVRDAIAGGRVYGRDRYSKPSGRHWNMLWSGAQVTQCDLLSESELADLRDGGTFNFTLRRSFTSAAI